MNEDDLPGPPYPAELLADLHAGVLAEDVASRLWESVRRDADAMAFLGRLDAVQMQLRALREPGAAAGAGVDAGADGPATGYDGDTRIPPEVAARIDAALAAQRPPARIGRRALATAGIGIAAALAVVFAIALRPDGGTTATQAHAPDDGDTAQLVDDALTPESLRGVAGNTGLGPLATAGRLGECLSANGFAPDAVVVGSKEIRVAGDDAIVLLLSGPRPPQLTALVVGHGCSATDPATVRVETLG